ncbi:hypothetical protein AAE478_002721 [Parahypoxylon ruwenzoriense]
MDPGRSPASSEYSLRNSTDQVSTSNAYGQYSNAPVRTNRGGLARPLSGIVPKPSSYQTYESSKALVPGNMPLDSRDDFPGRFYKSLDKPQPNLTTVEPNTGLKSLFQEPVRLRAHSASHSNGTVRVQITPKHASSVSPSLPESLSTVSSTTSLSSQVSGLNTHDRPGSSELRTSQPRAHHYALSTASRSGAGAEREIGQPAHTPNYGTARTAPTMDSQSHHIGLSQLFVYQARMVQQPSRDARTTSPTPGGAVLFELESTPPQSAIPPRIDMARSSVPRSSSSLLSHQATVAPQPPGSRPVVPEPGSRRDVVDSKAWQRKTRMFQLNVPDDG